MDEDDARKRKAKDSMDLHHVAQKVEEGDKKNESGEDSREHDAEPSGFKEEDGHACHPTRCPVPTWTQPWSTGQGARIFVSSKAWACTRWYPCLLSVRPEAKSIELNG